MIAGSYANVVRAVERVQQMLERVTAALEASGVAYAVIGGNAVAFWVARIDEEAVRNTKDVDLLIRRGDAAVVSEALEGLGLVRHDLRRMLVFTPPDRPNKRTGVHLVWANEKPWPSNPTPSPDVTDAVQASDGMRVLDLPQLVLMKLNSFRDVDRTHIGDLLSVGLIDERVRASLPEVLRERLAVVEAGSWGWEHE